MSAPSPTAAVVALLLADPDVSTLAGQHVYGGELPDSALRRLPAHTVLVRPAGGGSLIAAESYLRLQSPRVDTLAYGPTPWEAERLHLAIHSALRHARRGVAGDALIHHVRSSGGALPARDPDGEWPYVVSSWQVLISEVAVA